MDSHERTIEQRESPIPDGKGTDSFYKFFFEKSPIPFLIIDTQGYPIIFNEAFASVGAYAAHELKKQPISHFLHAEDVEAMHVALSRTSLRNLESVDISNRFKRKDGSYVSLIWRIAYQPEQQFHFCICNKGLEAQISSTEKEILFENFNLILKGIQAGVWHLNRESGKLWWSNSLYKMLKYQPEAFPISIEKFWELIHPEELEIVKSAIDSHLYEKKPYKYEARMLTGEGIYKWVEISAHSIRDAKGHALRTTGSLIDIDHRKKIQLELEYHEFLLKQAANMAKVGAWQVEFEPFKLSWSHEIYRIHEVNHDYVPDKESALDFYCEESQPIITAAFENTLETGTPYDLELKIITAKNRKIWVRAIGQPILNKKGEISGLRGSFQDIDQRKKREISLQNSLNLISQQNKRLSNFAYIVSHNLRSHMSNFDLLLELYERTKLEDEKEKILDMGYLTYSRLKETIDHLTKVVEINADLNHQKENVNLNQILSNILETLSMNIHKTRARIYRDFEEVNEIEYVPAYMESIFLNLISNSLKYRHPDRDPRIHIRSYLENGRTVLSIQDNGVGMDLEANKDKLFGMFSTFHNHPESRGIGLFLTKSHVEALGGSIEVKSIPSIGTTFFIYL